MVMVVNASSKRGFSAPALSASLTGTVIGKSSPALVLGSSTLGVVDRNGDRKIFSGVGSRLQHSRRRCGFSAPSLSAAACFSAWVSAGCWFTIPADLISLKVPRIPLHI
ncbi:uncharacterized protein LOC133800897 [Humulus lupulus]|uniref:uncharacterized protein LOC133800897 n=1 Tax=Humulus lupulus TaxID=3486 RepID=UPI002B40E3FC|nr:uncharacterized protein LOC133800897 [Humulus lupulus]